MMLLPTLLLLPLVTTITTTTTTDNGFWFNWPGVQVRLGAQNNFPKENLCGTATQRTVSKHGIDEEQLFKNAEWKQNQCGRQLSSSMPSFVRMGEKWRK